MQPFKNRAETFIALFILIALGVLSAYLAVFLAFLGLCAYLYLEYEANNLGFHVEVLKSAILSSSIWLQSTMSSFVRNLQQRSGLVSDEPKSEMHNISRPDSPVTSRLRRVSIATNGSRYSRNSDLNISRSPTRYRVSPANRSVLDVCNRSDNRSPQKQSYNEAMGYAYKSSPWNRNAHSPVSEKTRKPSNTSSVRTVQNVGGPLLASSRSNSVKTFDLRVYADANSPGLAERSVHYSRSGAASADENRRPLSPLAVTHQPQYRTVGQFPLVRLGQKGSVAGTLPLLTAAVSPKAPRAHSVSMNVSPALVESPVPAPLVPAAGKAHSTMAPGASPPSLSVPDRSDPHDISAKSVIEALKEISRKRIRSQCLTPNEVPDDESAKRQRRNASADSGRAGNSEATENTASPVTPTAYQKRGRSDSFNTSGESGSAPRGSANDETPGVRSRVKRLCSNEILSSLSSSRCLLALAANNKRKFTISPDGSPRSGTPVPVQTGKHFKSGSSPDTEEQNGREEDTVHAMETPVLRRVPESVAEEVEDTPASATVAYTETPARDAGASVADGEDVTPEHWKRPKDADRGAAVPHRGTPHPARKLVGAKDLAEQRRADRSALVGLLTVIGKGESPFRDADHLRPPAPAPSARLQKHVSFADTQQSGQLARADTTPITESQQAPCVGTPMTDSSPGQGGMAGTGTTNTPPTVSRNTQKAQSFTLHSSPTGSVMSSSAAASGRSPSPFTVSAGRQTPSSDPLSDSTVSTSAAQTASPFTARPVAASTPATASGVLTSVASSPFSSTSGQVSAISEMGGTPTGARAAPGDAASQPQVHMSTATSTAFSFGSPKMSTVATVSATPTTSASAGEFRFSSESVTATATTAANAGGFSFTLPTSTATSATSPPKVAFQFGQSATSTAAEAKRGGFQFTPGSADKSSRQAATSGPGATASQPSIFSSSAAYSKATVAETGVSPFAAVTASKSQTTVTATTVQKGVFGGVGVTTTQQSIFGGSATPVFGASNATATQAPTFGTTAMSTSQTPTLGSTAATTQSSVFGTSVFGSTPLSQSQPTSGTSNVTRASTFGSATAAATPAFGSATTAPSLTFGSGTTTQATSFGGGATSQAPAFGSGATSQAPAFGSGATSQAPAFGSGATSQAPAFGSGATSQAPAFGSGATSQAPAFGSGATSQAPAFGSGATSQAPAFGSGATTQASAFGAVTSSETPAFGSSTTTLAPAFGAVTSPQTPAFGSGTAQTATFGAITTSQTSAFAPSSKPAFGSGTANGAPAFGSSTQTQPTMFGTGTTQAPAFGTGSNRVVTFGSGTSGQTPAGSTDRGTAPTSGSQVTAFGAGATGQASVFGSTSGQTSAFGSPTARVPAFGTGSSGSTPAFGSANRSTLFGSGAAPSFGTASSTASSTQSSVFGAATPTFGSSGASRPPFSTGSPFGSTPAFGSTSTGQTPVFGSPFAASGDAKPAFGSAAQASTAVTTAGQQAVFAFGSTSTAPVTTTAAPAAAPFQFGATGQTASATTPKPGGFQFGQSADASPAAFTFGAPAGQTSTPKPAFQFNAGGQTPGGSVPNVFGQGAPGSVGMFSIGSGSTAPRSRTSRMRNKNR